MRWNVNEDSAGAARLVAIEHVEMRRGKSETWADHDGQGQDRTPKPKKEKKEKGDQAIGSLCVSGAVGGHQA